MFLSKTEMLRQKKTFFETILIVSEIEPNLFETGDGGDFVNKVFNNFLVKSKLKGILEICLWELFLQIRVVLIVLLEIFLGNQFLKKVTVIGLMYCPQ